MDTGNQRESCDGGGKHPHQPLPAASAGGRNQEIGAACDAQCQGNPVQRPVDETNVEEPVHLG